MKKLKNEKELVKKAIAIGVEYAEKRGAVEFEPHDTASRVCRKARSCRV
jgi:hypothetical protein